MIALDVQISTGWMSLVTDPDPALSPPADCIAQIALNLRLHYWRIFRQLAAYPDGGNNFDGR